MVNTIDVLANAEGVVPVRPVTRVNAKVAASEPELIVSSSVGPGRSR